MELYVFLSAIFLVASSAQTAPQDEIDYNEFITKNVPASFKNTSTGHTGLVVNNYEGPNSHIGLSLYGNTNEIKDFLRDFIGCKSEPITAAAAQDGGLLPLLFDCEPKGLCQSYSKKKVAISSESECAARCLQAGDFCIGMCYTEETKSCILYGLPESLPEKTFVRNHLGYFYPGIKLSHPEAVAYCNARQMSMSLPVNRREEDLVKVVSDIYFIGATDVDQEGAFLRVSDGAPITYSKWGPDEPNSGRRENCVMIWTNTDQVWNDYDCTAKIQFVCQWPVPGLCMDAPRGSGVGVEPTEVCYIKRAESDFGEPIAVD